MSSVDQLGAQLVEATRTQSQASVKVDYGTVTAVNNANNTLTVSFRGATISGIQATGEALAAEAGQRVVLLVDGPLVTAIGTVERGHTLGFLGINITGGKANDTREFWKKKGTGYAFFSQTDQLVGQPTQHGFLFSIVYGNEIFQVFYCQSGTFKNGRQQCFRSVNHTATTMPNWNSFGLNAYPIGAVYISYVSTSPASIFGGSWAEIKGVFPYFNSGTGTGGSNSHTLTVAQMPSHNHATGQGYYTNPGSGSERQCVSWEIFTGDGWSPQRTSFTGSTQGHNNAPAYQTFYAWRRTA